jgi:hypothetical protein
MGKLKITRGRARSDQKHAHTRDALLRVRRKRPRCRTAE